MRSVLIVIFVFFYLLLGLPVLGAMWIIHKFAPAWADMAQLRLVQWAFRVIIFLSGADIEFIGGGKCAKGRGCTIYRKSP